MKEVVVVVGVTGVTVEHHNERPFCVAGGVIGFRNDQPGWTAGSIAYCCRESFRMGDDRTKKQLFQSTVYLVRKAISNSYAFDGSSPLGHTWTVILYAPT